ncbi:hypothetical protein QF050_003116 [Arthrobacter sp. SLBN-112]|nr:hypothetical protein [Arthrobacter sp. SLBN-112]
MPKDSNNFSTTEGTSPVLQQDWLLTKGTLVEARHRHHLARTGLVDDVTPDGSILWLAADGALTRHMIDKSDGYEIWSTYEKTHGATPQPLAAPPTYRGAQ